MADRSTTPEGHTVSPQGALLRTSPSQIKTWDLCPRAWFFDKVAHLPRKHIAAQDVGTQVHAQIEHYLRTSENVLGPIALAGKHLLPAPGADLVLEAPIMPLEIEGIPIIGYVDLVNPRQLEAHGLIEVTDHKTTSSIERYAKGVDELLKDPQLAIYCMWALKKWPNATSAIFAHIYYQTRGAKCSERVSVSLSPLDVAKAWDVTGAKVRGMKVAAAEKDPQKVPCSLNACGAYGGCSYAGACPDSPSGRTKRSFFDALKTQAHSGATREGEGVLSGVVSPQQGTAASLLPRVASRESADGAREQTSVLLRDDSCRVGESSPEASRPMCHLSGGAQTGERYSGGSRSQDGASARTSLQFVQQGFGAVSGLAGAALDGSELSRSHEERVRKPMSLMERLQKQKSASPAPAPAAAPTNVAAPAAPAVPPPAESAPAAATVAAPAASTSTPATASGAIPASECKEGEIYQLPIDKAAGRPEVTFGECKGVAGSWVLFQAKSGIARVRVTEKVYTADATVPAAEPEAPKAEAKPAEPPASGSAVVPPDAPKSAPPAPAAEAKPAETTPAAEAPKKRGRPAKAAAVEPAGTSSPAAVQAAHEANAQLTDGILVLLVNAVSNQPAQDLTGYVAKLAADAAKVAGVEDVRIANDGPLAFGKWKGYLATMARESPPSGRCVIFSGELADPVIEALSSIAAEVIRGR